LLKKARIFPGFFCLLCVNVKKNNMYEMDEMDEMAARRRRSSPARPQVGAKGIRLKGYNITSQIGTVTAKRFLIILQQKTFAPKRTKFQTR
jgi:hypothetical protein